MILLQIISVLIVVSALIAALIIGLDLTRRRQPMRIMNPVWILTGLWAGAGRPMGLRFRSAAPVRQPPTAGPDRGRLPTPSGRRTRSAARSSERPNRVPGRPPRQPKGNARHTRTEAQARTEHLGSLCENGLRQRTGPTTAPNGHASHTGLSTHAPYGTANKRAIIPSAMPPMPKTVGPEGDESDGARDHARHGPACRA